jgi:outer membrane lipoprotein-sorting protein
MNFFRRIAMLSRCTIAPIQMSAALLVFFTLAHSPRALAANPEDDAGLTGSRQRIEKMDYRLSGRLIRVDATGKRTSYKFVGKGHWFPDGLRLLCEISGPGSDKTTLLVKMTATGQVTIDAVLPGEKTASALPFEHWGDPLVGTDFSYEDMLENQFFWKNQESLKPEKYGARDCFVLKSKPGSQDKTHYDSATSWVDRNIFFPLHVVKTLRGTSQQKEFIYYGLRQNGGAWGASKVEAKVPGKPGYSILEVEGGSGKANLARKDFELSQFNTESDKGK